MANINLITKSQLTDILEKRCLQVKQRLNIYFFAISVETQKFRIFHIVILGPFKKIKRFKKIMISGNVVFIGLRAVKPEPDRVDPLVHF